MPGIGDLVGRGILAALLEAIDGHVNEHLAEDLGRALGDHERTVLRLGVGVPGGDDDAGIRGLLQGVGHASGVNRGDAEGVDAIGDGLVDDAHLVRGGSAGGAEVVNRETPVLGVLLSAVVRGLEEGVARDLRDEGNGLAGDVAASGLTARSSGRSGGTGAATAADQAEARDGCTSASHLQETATSHVLHNEPPFSLPLTGHLP